MEFFGYLMSLAMGLILGMMGAGGSIMTVPILVYLFQVPAVLATTSSLFIVGVAALVGATKSIRSRELDLKVGGQFALFSFVGIFISRYFVLPLIPDVIFEIAAAKIHKDLLILVCFACLMIAAARAMLKAKPTGNSSSVLSKNQSLIGLHGFNVGLVTGFVGAGGGFLIVPVLVNLLGLPMRAAVGTSLLVVAANSFFGFFVSYLAQDVLVDWLLMFGILACALLGLFLGSFWTQKIEEGLLKKAFGYFVLLAGTFIILEQLSHVVRELVSL